MEENDDLVSRDCLPGDGESGDMVFGVPPLPALRLRVELTALEAARLPGFKGSTLRGAFGHALRELACVQEKSTPCGSCPLQAGCAYARLFEPAAAGAGPFPQRRGDQVPRPYVFECADRRRRLKAGQRLTFDLLLLGQAVELQVFVVASLQRLGDRGLGQSPKPFRLERIHVEMAKGFALAYERGTKKWTRSEPLLPMLREDPERKRLCLRLRTPLRVERRGRTLETLSLSVLAQQILRRARQLSHFHGEPLARSEGPTSMAAVEAPGPRDQAGGTWQEPRDSHQEALFAAVRRVRLASCRLRWADLQRHSQRQGRLQPCGGLVGEMELVGDVGPLLPLLRLAEIIHVGKKTVLGLGQVEVAV